MTVRNIDLEKDILEERERHWLLCPVCQNKTRTMLRRDTQLYNFPLFCPKCRQEKIVHVQNNIVTVIKEPDAKTQSR